jgi:type VI secretion system secreted protein Hcp
MLVVLLTAASAPADIFLRLSGTSQGNIYGDATQQNHEEWIEVEAFSHSITVPTASNGLPTGSPQTSPLSISKVFDRASVKLFRAATTLETMDQFTLDFMRTGQGGQQELYYVIRLYNARITDLSQSGSGVAVPSESLSFVYEIVELEDPIHGTFWSYDWNTGSTTSPEPLAKGLLLPPAPNPSRGETEFRFALPVASNAELSLFDLRGRLIKQLHNGFTSSEPVVALWDGTDEGGMRVAQGLYIARLTYPGTVVTQRLTLLR